MIPLYDATLDTTFGLLYLTTFSRAKLWNV